MALPFMLLAASAVGAAGGLAAGHYGTKRQNKMARKGMAFERMAMETDVAIEQATLNFENQMSQLRLDMDIAETEVTKEQLNLEMQQEQLASTQEAQLSIENLREVMASHQAIFAARGQQMSGSAISTMQKPLRQFNREEQARTLTSEFRKLSFQNKNRLLANQRGSLKTAKSLLDIEATSKSHLLNIQRQSKSNLMNMQYLTSKYAQQTQRNIAWTKAGLNMFSMNQAMSSQLNGNASQTVARQWENGESVK